VAALLLCFLILAVVIASAKVHKKDGKKNLKASQCGRECQRRCFKTHHKKSCLFFFNKCCAKCLQGLLGAHLVAPPWSLGSCSVFSTAEV
jgi:hypothetical protein